MATREAVDGGEVSPDVYARAIRGSGDGKPLGVQGMVEGSYALASPNVICEDVLRINFARSAHSHTWRARLREASRCIEYVVDEYLAPDHPVDLPRRQSIGAHGRGYGGRRWRYNWRLIDGEALDNKLRRI